MTVAVILRAVSIEFGIPEAELLSERRAPRTCAARHAAMALAREMTLHSLPRISRALRRDHSTVIKGIRRHQQRLATNPEFAAQVRAVLDSLQGANSNA